MLSHGWPAYWTPGFQHKTPEYPSAREELNSTDFTLLPIFILLSFYSIFLTSMCSTQTLLSFPKGKGKGSAALNWAAEPSSSSASQAHRVINIYTFKHMSSAAPSIPTLSPLLNPSAPLCPARRVCEDKGQGGDRDRLCLLGEEDGTEGQGTAEGPDLRGQQQLPGEAPPARISAHQEERTHQGDTAQPAPCSATAAAPSSSNSTLPRVTW